jgi:predicted RNase H-like HicB family nuclease
MFAEYILTALEKAQYKVIDNCDEPYYVDVPELDGVWATSCTVEDARRNFIEALEDWIAAHLLWNLALHQGDQAANMPLRQSKRESISSF